RDLHDEVGPFLFAVDVDAQAIPALLNKGATVDVSARAQAIRQSVAHMQSHLRSVLNRLRPGLMLDLGVAQAAEQLASFWRARYPAIQFDIDCADESFGAALDETAFRVLQEGASNAVRHGKPTRIAFATRKLDTGMLVVSVTDDGAGLKATERDGFGLSGMRERLARMGGTLSIHANPNGRGVILRAEMPYVQTPRPRPTQQEDTSAAP
ncbi:MAG: ATP-binding protein, partial [Hyphomicrobium sp.]